MVAWRINKSVVRGEIDNTRKGRVTGQLWLLGREEPVTLDLEGDCLRDLAGTRFGFVNPAPEAGDPTHLAMTQCGRVGDMTASRKVRDIPLADVPKLVGREVGDLGSRYPLVNSLYLEWFSDANGRVVLESTGFRIELGERVWTLTPEDEEQQQKANRRAIRGWIDELAGAATEAGRGGESADDDGPMDEFQWERFMKESDACTDKFSKLFEKYADDPDRDRLIAREMGWTWIEEAMDEAAQPANAAEEDLFSDLPELVPNPLTEGTDWVRDEHGHIEHPLTLRAHRLGMDMWHFGEDRDQLKEDGDPDFREMVFKTQTTGAKLAGALNHLAYEDDPDGGFVVAALKRALGHLHGALAAAVRCRASDKLDGERLRGYEQNLFEIRQEILALMQRYRQMI